jgi:antirestriction protein ArdC
MKKKNETKEKKDFYQETTNQIIQILENQQESKKTCYWLPPVEPFANNPFSNTIYQMFNQLLLSFYYQSPFSDYKLNRWMTFKQAKKLNAKVKKGAKSKRIYFTNYIYLDPETGKNQTQQFKKLSRKDQKELLQKNELISIPFLKRYSVFNIDDIEDLPKKFYQLPERNVLKGEKNEIAENIIKNTSASILYKLANKAANYHNINKIVLPPRADFEELETFYSTAFHELIHWSGDKSRLDREKASFKNNPKTYAFEELIAELGAAYLCAYCGIAKPITDNAGYIKSWLQALNDDKKFILKAAAKAEKAAKYVLLDSKIIDYSMKNKS